MDPVPSWIARMALVLLLATAAWHKTRDLPAFRDSVVAYRVIPDAFARALAPLLPAIETGVALALLVPATARGAALGAGGLLALYTAAIAWNLGRGRRQLDCGCYGPAHRQPISEALLVRNALWIGAAVVAGAPIAQRALGWLDALTVASALASGALLYSAAATLGVSRSARPQPGSSS